MGTNEPSVTAGDPYGVNGPLPPDTYDLPNAWSPGKKRVLPSPTNIGRPGEVRTPSGTNRNGIRVHDKNLSRGCLTTGSGQAGADVERFLVRLVDRNKRTGGTTLTIEEVSCSECQKCASR